jgi:hypothetical protein
MLNYATSTNCNWDHRGRVVHTQPHRLLWSTTILMSSHLVLWMNSEAFQKESMTLTGFRKAVLMAGLESS